MDNVQALQKKCRQLVRWIRRLRRTHRDAGLDIEKRLEAYHEMEYQRTRLVQHRLELARLLMPVLDTTTLAPCTSSLVLEYLG